ncbi:MAG: xanthine dehydrogenase family protein subunit M [Anaerolineaceae bacterium]|nr:xanthine dehydrogenase family protein subunit M [Anaerolineaceae bacterium]MCB9101560.1 xanthine dehydrogenase family protein subunit M [Anaerolineales bacterium]
MKPPPFEYFAPTTLDEALDYMADYGDEAKPLAGGQSLIPTMNFRLAQPEVLVDLNGLAELAYIRPAAGGVSIGAMTRQRSVERSPLVAEQTPLIHETMPYIAHPQIRNRGTFGGNLAHTDPASELPAVATALNARFRAQSRSGQRWLTADEFFVDLFTTALEPEELLVEIVIPPLPARTGYAFHEISRRHGDYALVGVAATVTLDDSGLCEAARLVYFSVGDKPVEAVQATAALAGQKLSAAAIDAAAEIAATQDIDPPGDIHASVAYRRHLAKVLARQVLAAATARAKQD